MPAAPLWIHRLADALPTLTSLPQDLVDRRTLEEVLGVGKRTAWRIMRQCGAGGAPGGPLVSPRDPLLALLQAAQQAGPLGSEIARRERVARYLDGMQRYASRRHKTIARNTA